MWSRRDFVPCCGVALLLFVAAAETAQQTRELLNSPPSAASRARQNARTQAGLNALFSSAPTPAKSLLGSAFGPNGLNIHSPSSGRRMLLADAPKPGKSPAKAPSPTREILDELFLSPVGSPGSLSSLVGQALGPTGLNIHPPSGRKLLADAPKPSKSPAESPKEAQSPKTPSDAPKPAKAPKAEGPSPKEAKTPSTGRRRTLLAHDLQSAKLPLTSAPDPDSVRLACGLELCTAHSTSQHSERNLDSSSNL